MIDNQTPFYMRYQPTTPVDPEIEGNEDHILDRDDENSAYFQGRRSEPDDWYDPLGGDDPDYEDYDE